MTILDIIQVVDKSMPGYADIDEFLSLFGMEIYTSNEGVFESRVRKYYVPGYTWVCTDTQVGIAVYLMDDIPIAISSQVARKNQEIIEFLSAYGAKLVFDLIFEIIKDVRKQLPIANIDENIDSWKCPA